MAIDSSVSSKPSNGLKTALDIIIAPNEALSAIRVAPTWAWAFGIAAILSIIGYILARPAALHGAVGTIQHMLATSPLMTNLSDAQRQQMIANAEHPSAIATASNLISSLGTILIAALINAVVLLAANAVGRGTATFKMLWSGSVHIAIPSLALGTLVTGIITTAIGADHFNSISDMLAAIPNLGMIVPGLTGFAAAFLRSITVFALWGMALNIMMMRTTARVTGPIAWIAPVIITLFGAFTGAAFAHAFGG
ncbi:MAG: hypothetical protein ACYDGM_05695 [Vulcanimicrobiaceae bacterium]